VAFNVLMVDDEEHLIEGVKTGLHNNEISFAGCGTIDAAKEKISAQVYEIIIIDMNLPQNNESRIISGGGVNLIKFIKEKSPTSKIIMITGSTDEQHQDEYLTEQFPAGINEFILKEDQWLSIVSKKITDLYELYRNASDGIQRHASNKFIVYDPNKKITDHLLKHHTKYHFTDVISAEDCIDKLKKIPVSGVIVHVSADVFPPDSDQGIILIREIFRQISGFPFVAITENEESKGFERMKDAMKEGAIACARILPSSKNNSKNNIESALRKAIKITEERLVVSKDIIGRDPVLMCAIHTLATASDSDAPVLILGENGTGKELFANAIHKFAHTSCGREENFIAVNCAAIPKDLIESELFGIGPWVATGVKERKGKFELANRGTIFLDEIGNMDFDLQAKLLRVIEYKVITRVGETKEIPVDVKMIYATNQDLPQLIHDKNFREDLYFRMKVFSINLPPLKYRKHDIQCLAYYFIGELSKKYKRSLIFIDDAVINKLKNHEWPGNIRELRNLLESVVAHIPKSRDFITESDVKEALSEMVEIAKEDSIVLRFPSAIPEKKRLKKWGKLARPLIVMDSLKRNDGNMDSVAKDLGIMQNNLYPLIKAGIKIALEQTSRAKLKDIDRALELLSVRNCGKTEALVRKMMEKVNLELV